jgi:hypothetical protein
MKEKKILELLIKKNTSFYHSKNLEMYETYKYGPKIYSIKNEFGQIDIGFKHNNYFNTKKIIIYNINIKRNYRGCGIGSSIIKDVKLLGKLFKYDLIVARFVLNKPFWDKQNFKPTLSYYLTLGLGGNYKYELK